MAKRRKIQRTSPKNTSFSVPSSRKTCHIERNKGIFQNARSFPNFLNINSNLNMLNKKCLSTSILPLSEENWTHSDSKFTQTINEEIYEEMSPNISTTSTQTEILHTKNIDFTNEHCGIRKCRSESYILGRDIFVLSYARKMDEEGSFSSKDNLVCEGGNKLITLHKNENIRIPSQLPPSRIPIRVKNPLENTDDTLKEGSHNLNRKIYTFRKKKKSKRKICLHYYKNKNFNKFRYENNKTHDRQINSDYKIGSFDTFMSRMKKYRMVASKWFLVMFQFFTELGCGLKSSLINISKQYEVPSTQFLIQSCKCDKHREEIEQLKFKIEDLNQKIKTLQADFKKSSENTEKIETFIQKFEKITKELESFENIKSELEILKKLMDKSSTSAPIDMTSHPPPPPPLPPPPMPVTCHSTSFIRVLQGDRKLRRFDTSRPIITLEEILNVKLRKISVPIFQTAKDESFI